MIRLFYSLITQVNLWRNRKKTVRHLEIGPGSKRIPGFETLDIKVSKYTDYVLSAARRLPFKDNTFDLIYASHILEHIVWYQVEQVLAEWVRILKPGGKLEIWVPDGLKICRALVDYELHNKNYIHKDGWYKYNPNKEVCRWAAGRLYTYGDGTGNPKSENWHRAIFTPRYLRLISERAGLRDVCQMEHSEIRGHDHGWINLGIKGIKI